MPWCAIIDVVLGQLLLCSAVLWMCVSKLRALLDITSDEPRKLGLLTGSSTSENVSAEPHKGHDDSQCT